MNVEVVLGVARFPDSNGEMHALPLDASWYDDVEMEVSFGGVAGRIEHEIMSAGDDVDRFDLAAIAPALERAIEDTRDEHEHVEKMRALRETLPLGQLARELRAEPEEAEDVLVPGFLRAGGVTLISGREKRSGKSTWMASIMRSLERDEPTPLGPALGRKVKTLWVTEEPKYSLREKCDDFGLEDVFIVYTNEWPTAGKQLGVDLTGFERKLEIVGQIAVEGGYGHVVIDPLARIAGIEDESGGGEMNRAVNAASELAKRTGVAVTLIHHDNKSDGRAVEDRMRGTTATAAAADQIVHIERKQPKMSPRARWFVAWGRVRASEWERVFVLDDDGHGYTEKIEAKPDGDGDDEGSGATPLDALKAIEQPATMAAILEQMGLAITQTNRQAMRRKMEDLESSGLVTATKPGREYLYAVA